MQPKLILGPLKIYLNIFTAKMIMQDECPNPFTENIAGET